MEANSRRAISGPMPNGSRGSRSRRHCDPEQQILELWLWIEDGEGNVVSTRAGGPLGLAPGDAPVHMDVSVRQPLPEEQELMVKWRDANGEHTESTGIPAAATHVARLTSELAA
jgi:hypothetical protein